MPTASVRTELVPGTPRIAVDHAGTGQLVLFLHGIGGNRTNWTAQVTRFAAGFHAAAWDLRGYGSSDDYEGPLQFSDVRDDLSRVLDYFEAPACHLVGLSLGARIGFDYVHHCPGRVLSFTACSGVAFPDDMTPDTRKLFLDRRKAPLLAGGSPKDIAAAVAASLAGPQCSPEALAALVASISELHKESYLKTLETTSVPPERFDLAFIGVPVHVVAAGHDSLFPPEKLKAIAGAIPGAAYSEISEAGHLSNLEFPELFNELVLRFVSAHTARTPAT